jgi:ribosomal-protein-serine acetyltransferase
MVRHVSGTQYDIEALMQPSRPTLVELPPEIRGERVVLRPWRAEDAELLFAAIDESREQLRPWVRWVDKHASVDDTRDYCVRAAANWLLRTELPLGIFHTQDDRILGGIDFHSADWSLPSFAIGFWLRASAVRQGFMTESVRLLVALAFENLHARRVELSCDPRNKASRRIADRTGFNLEGRLRNINLGTDGEPRDLLIFSLVPEDWDLLRSRSS